MFLVPAPPSLWIVEGECPFSCPSLFYFILISLFISSNRGAAITSSVPSAVRTDLGGTATAELLRNFNNADHHSRFVARREGFPSHRGSPWPRRRSRMDGHPFANMTAPCKTLPSHQNWLRVDSVFCIWTCPQNFCTILLGSSDGKLVPSPSGFSVNQKGAATDQTPNSLVSWSCGLRKSVSDLQLPLGAAALQQVGCVSTWVARVVSSLHGRREV